MNIGDLIFNLLADGSKLEADVTRQAQAAGDKAGAKAGTTLGNRMSQTASRGLTALGAASGVVFAGAVESGAAFEDQLRTINTVAGLSDEQLSKVGDDIQALSRETGKTTDDLTAGFYDLVSAGVDADDAIGVLRDSAIFATGALGSTAQTVDLVTSVMNAYGLEASESTRITDVFAKAVADGKVTAAQLGDSIAQIAPIASSAGISIEEVSSGFAVLTAKGVPASEAATQMQAAIRALIKPNEDLNRIQEQTGINFAELAREKGLAVALEELRRVTGGSAEAMTNALGRTEAYQFALASTGDQAETFAQQIVDTANESGLALEQYDEKSKSSVEQGKRFAAVLNTLAQDFGGAFSGAAPFLVTLNQLGPAFRGLISPAKIFGGALGGIASKGLQLLGGPFAKLGRGLALKLAAGLGSTAAQAAITNAVGETVGNSLSAPGLKAKLGGKLGPLGKFLGSGLGKAFSVGFAAAAVVGVVETYNQIKEQTAAQNAQISADVGNQIKTGTDEQLAQTKAALETGLTQLNGVWDAGLFTNETRAKLTADLDAVNAEMSKRASTGATDVSEAYRDGAGVVTAGAEDMVEGVPGAVEGVGPEAEAAAAGLPADVASGIRSARQAPIDAFDQLKTDLENAMTPAAERARLVGQLTSKELAKGLKSGDPVVRAQAQAVKDSILQRLNEIPAKGNQGGKATSEAIAKGLRSKNPAIRAAAQEAKALIDGQIKKIPPAAKDAGEKGGRALATGINNTRTQSREAANRTKNSIRDGWNISASARGWGVATGRAYGSGIRSTAGWIRQAAANALAAAKSIMATHSPPGPDSPLHDIVDWARETMQFYAGGIEGEAPTVAGAAKAALSDAAGVLADATFGTAGIRTPAMRAIAPAIPGLPTTVSPAALAATAAAAPPGLTGEAGAKHYHLHAKGALPVRTIRDVQTELRRISDFDEMPPRTLASKYRRREAEEPA